MGSEGTEKLIHVTFKMKLCMLFAVSQTVSKQQKLHSTLRFLSRSFSVKISGYYLIRKTFWRDKHLFISQVDKAGHGPVKNVVNIILSYILRYFFFKLNFNVKS